MSECESGDQVDLAAGLCHLLALGQPLWVPVSSPEAICCLFRGWLRGSRGVTDVVGHVVKGTHLASISWAPVSTAGRCPYPEGLSPWWE